MDYNAQSLPFGMGAFDINAPKLYKKDRSKELLDSLLLGFATCEKTAGQGLALIWDCLLAKANLLFLAEAQKWKFGLSRFKTGLFARLSSFFSA